jgi:transcriptional regulator with PAS, ATPase and Fis domain
MRLADLDLRELLSFEPHGGVIKFGGQRALILDAVALGLLRSELIRTVGMAGARGILTRFGYAHGWRTAETLKTQFPWDDDDEWRLAGPRLHMLQGLVVNTPATLDPGASRQLPLEAIWHDSYEAEQHLLHIGQADEPVCWTLTGFVSGYTSYAFGRKAYAVEDKCRGKGDAVCRVIGHFREDWGDGLADLLPIYETATLDATLGHVADELKRIEKQLRARKKELGPTTNGEDASGLVASSAAMQKILDLARRVAKVDTTVLITGESGVGKERVARLIHDDSTRTGGPFVAVNCGALPENLLESELFGHAKGAFTGAAQDRPGLFEAANRGTLLLDEIGEVSAAMQVKLLRALQEREVRRVGENKTRTIDVRVLAATNRDLVAEVSAGRFRQDLYYRLRVVEIRVPPLRERRDDILPLARKFLVAAADRMQRKVTGFTPRAADHLVRHGWPGNVRELENAIERAVVLAKASRVDLDDLPEELALATPEPYAPGDVRPLEEIERNYIMAVLRANAGNKAKAAEQLAIGTATLYRKLKQYETAKTR